MIRKAGECEMKLIENMRGGPGTARVTNFVSAEELNEKGRMFARVVLEPGAGVGWHSHENESELCYFLKGQAVVNDNGTETIVGPGDVTVTAHGFSHSVTNKSDEDVEFIALVVYK